MNNDLNRAHKLPTLRRLEQFLRKEFFSKTHSDDLGERLSAQAATRYMGFDSLDEVKKETAKAMADISEAMEKPCSEDMQEAKTRNLTTHLAVVRRVQEYLGDVTCSQ